MNKPDYGIKVHLVAEIIIDGCHAGTIEGYALSEPDTPDLMDVCLIADPKRDDAGRQLPVDDVGTVLTESERDPIRKAVAAALYAEARRPAKLDELIEKWRQRRLVDQEVARARPMMRGAW